MGAAGLKPRPCNIWRPPLFPTSNSHLTMFPLLCLSPTSNNHPITVKLCLRFFARECCPSTNIYLAFWTLSVHRLLSALFLSLAPKSDDTCPTCSFCCVRQGPSAFSWVPGVLSLRGKNFNCWVKYIFCQIPFMRPQKPDEYSHFHLLRCYFKAKIKMLMTRI